MSYFPLFFDMKGRRVLVTGAGPVAQRRIRVLLEAEAEVTVVARELPDSADWLRQKSGDGSLHLYQMEYGEFRKNMAANREKDSGVSYFLVLAATGDAQTDRLAAEDGEQMQAFVNVAGVKEQSDFYFPGIARQGAVTVGVTAGGQDHRLARRVTERLRDCLRAIMDREE